MSATTQAPGQRSFDAGDLEPAHHDGGQHPGARDKLGDVLHAALRGAIAAGAMTGFRALTVNLGLVEKSPPRAMIERNGLFRMVPRKQRRAAIELMHWAFGAQGGALFGLLPDGVRHRRGSGPVYGLLLWLGFELVISPLLGLKRSKQPRPVERVAVAADHALYGFVLSEMGRRPQD